MRVGRSGLTRVAGAVSGQFSQALASFLLQVVAARALGASGLGTYALLYSVILTGAALCSGLVGDSLTVLARNERTVRSALVKWALGSAMLVGVGGAVAFYVAGLVSAVGAVLFGLAAVSFVLESMLRRVLMAVVHFWSLVLVDLLGLAVSGVTLVVWGLISPLDIDAMLVALVLGQLVGCVVAYVGLPAAERSLPLSRGSDLQAVLSYGGVRALQQTVRPGLLTVARLMMVAEAGRAAFGEVEAARVYMAPALLAVQGLGSYLFVSYARRPDAAMRDLLHRADVAVAWMVGSCLLLGAVATGLAPLLGPLVTGSAFSMSLVAVFGWAAFAAATAANMPYGSLAAVRGHQRQVLAWAVGTAVVMLVLAAVLLVGFHLSIDSVPYVLAAGSFAQGWLVRSRVLRRMDERRQPATAPRMSGDVRSLDPTE